MKSGKTIDVPETEKRKMHNLFEGADDAAIKDGGFVFQAILSYDMRWSIVDGEAKYDQRWVEGKLHQVDIYPDLKFMEGHATLNYVILSEVNLFKRKLDLATEYIKMAFSKAYADEMNGIVATQPDQTNGPITGGIPDVVDPDPDDLANIDFTDALNKTNQQTAAQVGNSGEISGTTTAGELGKGQAQLGENINESNLPATTTAAGLPATTTAAGLPAATDEPESKESEPVKVETTPPATKIPLTVEQKKAINDKYFKNTNIKITFKADRIVLREISTSSVESSKPTCTLKLSTGMVDTLDGQSINSWDNFKVYASGGLFDGMTIDNKTEPPISKATMYDPVDNLSELIFMTLLPSLLLEFSGDSVKIDTYSNRSAQVGFKANIDFDGIFKEQEASPIIAPEEGESTEEEAEDDTEDEEPTTELVKPPSESGEAK
jgi:hypothetical protein